MNPLLRNSEAHVFVRSLDEAVISFEDEHHLDRVLRLDPDDPITVSDGVGSWVAGTWSRDRGLRVTSERFHEPHGPWLVVGVAIPKSDRPELVVQKLSELGVDRILLFETARSVVRWDLDRRHKQLERLGRIRREASMQSRRVYLPTLEFTTYARAIEEPGMALAEPGGHDAIDAAITGILVGPEGGFDRDELDFAVPKISLGNTVLRVETAAIVAGFALTQWHGDRATSDH